MNQVLADNKVATLRAYLTERLNTRYDQRESQNISNELFRFYFQWDRIDLQNRRDERLSESEILKLHFALKRLLLGEPLQYVTGQAWFRGLQLSVGPEVLIPRPETEELVQLVLDGIKTSSPRILDIGTGSGCIALACKNERTDAAITAIDISEKALELAKKNAFDLGLEVHFAQGDALKIPTLEGPFDVIVSNPPYVLQSDKATMADHVLQHEPHLALFVEDEDPLIYYRSIAQWSKQLLSNSGFTICEMHESTEKMMTDMLKAEGVASLSFHHDAQQKIRFVRFNF